MAKYMHDVGNHEFQKWRGSYFQELYISLAEPLRAKGYHMEAVSRWTGVCQPSLCRWLRGGDLTLVSATKIAQYLELEIRADVRKVRPIGKDDEYVMPGS